MSRKAVVIGAGVIGLTTAITLQETGWQVEIITERITPCTVSDVAAAVWEPFYAEPRDLVDKWSYTTFETFKRQMDEQDLEGTGLRYCTGYQYLLHKQTTDPEWASVLSLYKKHTHSDGLPQRYKDGRMFTTIVAETPLYIRYLMGQYQRRGGKLRVGVKLNSLLNEHTMHADLIVNCTGAGAYELLNDRCVAPVRGLLVKVDAPWVKNFYFDDNESDANGQELAYIIPRSDGIICGGTAYKGDWSSDLPTDQQVAAILERCDKLCPGIKNAKVLSRNVGHRPWRTAIRLEPQVVQCPKTGVSRMVIHNYGHGGSGYTVCWGCAQSVARIAQEMCNTKSIRSRL